MRWRKLLRSLHRDIGYVCVGLTVVYAVSGVAVNHRHDWDYNYVVSQEVRQVGTPVELLRDHWTPPSEQPLPPPGELARQEQTLVMERLLSVLARSDTPYKILWRGRDRMTLLFGTGDRDLVDYLPSQGVVELQRREERPVLRQLNRLHLNEDGGVWTYTADAFAVALLFLALSGAFILRGSKGIRGRGAILMGAGIVIPLLALIFL